MLFRYGSVLLLFLLGILGGLLWKNSNESSIPRAETSSQDVMPPIKHEAPDKNPVAMPADPAAARELGDQMLRHGNAAQALAVYQEIGRRSSAGPDDALQYRIAIASEAVGQFDQANDAYGSVLSHSPDEVSKAAAQLGKARVHIRRNNPGEATALLDALILRSGLTVLAKHPLLGDASYLLALVNAHEAFPSKPPGPFDDALVSSRSVRLSVEHTLDWVSVGGRTQAGFAAIPETKATVRRQGTEAIEMLFSYSNPSIQIEDLLELVGAASGFSVNWTDAAKQRIGGRSVALIVDAVPLANLLAWVLDSPGVVWSLDGNLLRLATETEVDAKVLTSRRRAGARRSLRAAIADHPGHSLTPAAYLELGNDAAEERNLREAVRWYARLVREYPHLPLVAEAYYDLGIVQQQLEDAPAARAAFFQAIDRLPGNELTALSYLRIGRTLMDDGQIENSVSPLRRSISAASDSPTRAMAVVCLAASYLLTDNPRAANQALVEHRELLKVEPFRSTAGFLDALAHFRAGIDPREARREAGTLLESILATHGDTLLGRVGQMLLAQAYGEVGMLEQRSKVYERLLNDAQGAFAEQAAYLLAESLAAAENHEEARRLVSSVVQRSDGQWAARSRLLLARISLKEQHGDECLRWCRKMLSDPKQSNDAEVLKLMGQAYEQTGDTKRAAQCFAGRVPE
jgi:tetratricopeptide (TPR) repeat protein